METLSLRSARFWPLFGNLIFPATLNFDNENAYYKKKRIFFKPSETTVNISDIAFLDTGGIFNKSIDFGYTDQIFIKGISKKKCNLLKEHVISSGAKIGIDGDMIKSLPISGLLDLFKPLKWFLREKITTTDEAIIFVKKKLFSSKTTHLPYNKISFGLFEGVLSKRVHIIGEQNIISRHSFKNKEIAKLKNAIKEKGIDFKSGKAFRPFWFSSGRNLVNPPRLYCTENEIAYVDIQPFKDKVIKSLKYNEIASFRKAKWYSLLGSIVIPGNVDNIRNQSTVEYSREIKKEMGKEKPVIKDEEFANEIVILLKNVWFYRWRVFFFSTGIRKILKNHI